MTTLRQRHGNCPSTLVIREDSVDALRELYFAQMVEDKSTDQPSYAAWSTTLRDKTYTGNK